MAMFYRFLYVYQAGYIPSPLWNRQKLQAARPPMACIWRWPDPPWPPRKMPWRRHQAPELCRFTVVKREIEISVWGFISIYYHIYMYIQLWGYYYIFTSNIYIIIYMILLYMTWFYDYTCYDYMMWYDIIWSRKMMWHDMMIYDELWNSKFHTMTCFSFSWERDQLCFVAPLLHVVGEVELIY